MTGGPRLAACILAAVCATASARMAGAQQFGESFTYHAPGVMTLSSDRGVNDRRVFGFYPLMKFPLRVGPEAGRDGQPFRAFANSQVHPPAGNDPRLYVYPWFDTLCESGHQGGPMPACPTEDERTGSHQGIDIRPNSPTKDFYDVIAFADGTVTFVKRDGTTEVNIRSAANNGIECVYLHLTPGNIRSGQQVNQGDPIGKVSNHMGTSGTSIHLHIECKANHPDLGRPVKMPIYAALIAAYRHEWGLPDSVENGVLIRDPEREIEAGATPIPGDPTCSEPLTAPLEAVRDRPFIAHYMHNCSDLGLTLDTVAQEIKMFYFRPKQSLQQAAERKPVLVSGNLKPNGDFAGDAINFNRSCSDPSFKVAGHVDVNSTAIILQGDRQVLDSQCRPVNTQHETLRFAKLETSTNPPDQHPGDGLKCPFALPPGQQPQVVDGREIPPKSERSCNFTALTLPGNESFDDMPRYIREWPGVLKDVLIDRFEDQIITFRSAETGVGAWYYWLIQRAVNGPGLTRRGFGKTGRPTLAAVARAIAGADRSEGFVRQTYLGPYLTFAAEFFGHVVAESEEIDLSDSNARWNLARTMFRLESGRTPVVTRKQFECGIDLGNDIAADFARAGVEGGAASPVTFQSFKGLEFYTNTCTGPGPIPIPIPVDLADALRKLADANQQLQALDERVTQLLRDKADREQQLQRANDEVSALQARIAQLTSNPSPEGPDATALATLKKANADLANRIQIIGRELEMTNQMLETQQQICKLKDAICKLP
jgi:murein DD-endopeptidase MepM/ murein hydrolase activator NlpD